MRTVEMTGGWKAVENQTQLSHRFPPALEIAQAIPTFPTFRRLLDSFEREKGRRHPRLTPRIFSRLIFRLENTANSIRTQLLQDRWVLIFAPIAGTFGRQSLGLQVPKRQRLEHGRQEGRVSWTLTVGIGFLILFRKSIFLDYGKYIWNSLNNLFLTNFLGVGIFS